VLSKKRKLTLGYATCGSPNNEPFNTIFEEFKPIREGLEGIDCLVLYGGTDIHPSLYKQGHHPRNYAPTLPSDRDVAEWNALKYCKLHDIPTIGICRGAQMQCAFAGGFLIQHVNYHNSGNHAMTVKGERTITTNSLHHQMMFPWEVPHELIAWTARPLSDSYEDQEGNDIPQARKHPEPEIVYFPQIRGLGIQGHPEYSSAPVAFRELCVELVKQYLL
jgi:anthranilate/para-aminobenzoate synthase component II